MRLENGIGDGELGFGKGIGDFVLENGIRDWNWDLRLRIGIRGWVGVLGFGNRDW